MGVQQRQLDKQFMCTGKITRRRDFDRLARHLSLSLQAAPPQLSVSHVMLEHTRALQVLMLFLLLLYSSFSDMLILCMPLSMYGLQGNVHLSK